MLGLQTRGRRMVSGDEFGCARLKFAKKFDNVLLTSLTCTIAREKMNDKYN